MTRVRYRLGLYGQQSMLPRLLLQGSYPGYVVVEYPGGYRRYSVEELHVLAEELVFDFHCVIGWSIKSTKWIVVPLTKLLKGLGNRCWLVVESVTGYSTVLPCNLASSVYLAVGADGGWLPAERGGSVRVVAPPLFGWKHAKWVTRVRVVERYVDGFGRHVDTMNVAL